MGKPRSALTPITAAMVSIYGLNAPVLAQQAQPETAASTRQDGDDIIVTAQRRGEAVQKVPISITAFDATALQRSGIQNTADLQQRTPGLVLSTNASYGQPYIRGIGNDLIQPGTDSSVAVFVDGIYQSRAIGALADFYDMERVEVVKGPQGTLYGRNAAGGAISLFSRTPTDRIEAYALGRYGNYDDRRIEAGFNLPVGNDVAVRIAGFYNKRDGYTKDIGRHQPLDNADVWSLRGQVRLGSEQGASLLLGGEYVHDDGARNLGFKISDSATLPQPARDLAPVLGFTPPRVIADPRVVDYNSVANLAVRHHRLWAKGQIDIGIGTLQSLSGYTYTKNDLRADLDATEVDWAHQISFDRSRTFSQEFQIASHDDGPLKWVVGAYYLHEKGSQELNGLLPLVSFALQWRSSIKTDAYAGFGQATYTWAEKLRLTAGIRYSVETKRATFVQTINDDGGAVRANPRKTFRAWTPKFGIDYFVTPQAMLYVSATRGFKSGGFNLQNTGEEFGPETLWAYEGGVKSTFFAGALRFNAAAFHYDYKGLQVNQFVGLAAFVRNAASATIEGVEADMVVRPVRGLAIDSSLSYLHAVYDDYETGTADGNLAGNRLPRAPSWQIGAGATATLLDNRAGKLELRGELKYQSKEYFTPNDLRDVGDASYTIVNARLAFATPDDKWKIAIFGRNLTNTVYLLNAQRADSFFGTFQVFAPPRTYGVEIGYRL